MEQLLALRLADLTRPITVGIISPSDKNPVLVAAWQSGSLILSKKEVKLLCCNAPIPNAHTIGRHGCHGQRFVHGAIDF